MPGTVASEQHEPTSLRGIAEKAKADKRHRFRDLYRELTAEYLLRCWPFLNKDAASGVDRVTAELYAENLHVNVQKLAERLKEKNLTKPPSQAPRFSHGVERVSRSE